MRARPLLFALLATSFALPARGWIYVGNPKLTVVVDRPAGDLVSAEVHLDAVRVHKCAGGYDAYTVDEAIDGVEGFDVTIDGGDLCGVSLDWGGAMTIEASAWTAVHDEPHTSLALDGSTTVSVALTPFEVTSGTFSGSAPRLHVTVE